MQKHKLLTAAIATGVLVFGGLTTASAAPLKPAQIAAPSTTQTDANIIKVRRRHHRSRRHLRRRFLRFGFRRGHARRHYGFRRHYGWRRHYGLRRHRFFVSPFYGFRSRAFHHRHHRYH